MGITNGNLSRPVDDIEHGLPNVVASAGGFSGRPRIIGLEGVLDREFAQDHLTLFDRVYEDIWRQFLGDPSLRPVAETSRQTN